jgi:hypothetical protein
MMEELRGISLPRLPITGLQHVQHLDEHDGAPLISHYRHPRGSHYLYYWCDCDQSKTRWMLIRVSETDILRLVNQVVPLDHVVPRNALDEFVYFIDLGERGSSSVNMVAVSEIPEVYKPRTAYLQVPETFSPVDFALLIDKPQIAAGSSTQSIFKLPRVFEQVYAALYALRVLKPPRYVEIPWKDGFSGKRFYDWLHRQVPSEDRPEVEAFQFASPGFVKYSLRRDIGDMVSEAVNALTRNERDVSLWYERLDAYIFEKKLNDLYEIEFDRSTWECHDEYLMEPTSRLMSGTNLGPAEPLLASATPFEAAKIIMSLIRRIRELRRFERDGVVRFPLPTSSHIGSKRTPV